MFGQSYEDGIMSKSLRLSEKWFNRGLWLVAVVFAWFLTGLGSSLVGDLPKVEQTLQIEDFMDPALTGQASGTIRTLEQSIEDVRDNLQRTRLQHSAAVAATQADRDTFNNWLATRSATQRADQDQELIRRSAMLDQLKANERQLQQSLEVGEQQQFELQLQLGAARQILIDERQRGYQLLEKARRSQELRIFLYRLALTLPLLLIAGWLFAKKRKSPSWPFAWGFILFALFAFFVELVPYLPSYGGYVRYGVGVLITVLVGRRAITALNRYLELQKQKESLPDIERRRELGYDLALTRLSKGVCPGCERSVDLKNTAIDFCPHCGIGLHDHCQHCNTRKSAFDRFCHACGANGSEDDGTDGGNQH
jgi:predicted RNA-binding Zn-ribbon protein involved in translation (DUF1610 family)